MSMALSTPEIIMLVVQAILSVFWIWMFFEFIRERRFKGSVALIWLFGFIFLGIITAILYFFMYYTHDTE